MNENIYSNRTFTVSKHRAQNSLQFTSKIMQNVREGDRMLDIGCGDGPILSGLTINKNGIQYTGIDISKANIAEATNKYSKERINFLCADYVEHKFSDKFQLVVSYSTLNIIPNPDAVLKKISQDTASGGRLILGLPYDCIRSRIYIFLRKSLGLINQPALNRVVVAILNPLLRDYYSAEEIQQSMVYMTIAPYLIDSKKFRLLMTYLGFDLIDEELDLPNVIGKLSHKLLVFQKR